MRAKEIVRQIRAALPEGVDLVEFLPTLCDSLKLIKVKMAQPVGAVHPFPFSQAVKPELDLRATTKALKKDDAGAEQRPYPKSTSTDVPSVVSKSGDREYTAEESVIIDRKIKDIQDVLPWGAHITGVRIGADPVTKAIIIKQALVAVRPYFWHTRPLVITLSEEPGTRQGFRWLATYTRRLLDCVTEETVKNRGANPVSALSKALRRFVTDINGNPPALIKGVSLVGRKWSVHNGDSITKLLTFAVPGSPDFYEVEFVPVKRTGTTKLVLTRLKSLHDEDSEPGVFFNREPIPLSGEEQASTEKVIKKIVSFKTLSRSKS